MMRRMGSSNFVTALQAVETVRQQRSRGAQRLNVRNGVRFASSLAAALLAGLFEQPSKDLQ